jgi:Flp pilus assembly protein TadD
MTNFRAAPFVLLVTALLAGCNQRPAVAVASNAPSIQAARDALNEGEAGTSLAIARGVLTSQPNNVAALSQAGDAEAALGDRLAADVTYKKALALSPRDVRARLGLGKLQIRDDLRGAEATFRSILADAPNDPLVLNDLGYVLDMQERHAEAQTFYQAAIAADPARISSRVNLALSLALSGQAARAEGMMRDIAASSQANNRVRVDFAMAQVMAGHDKEAAATLGGDLTPAETQAAIDGMAQLRPAGTVVSQ